ncbi:hypothetical protein BgiBS90_023557 [Biomphalaria glabrata]|nr:hypothetical protein BgiBS90_023557 [Biomphalaria glabrata]
MYSHHKFLLPSECISTIIIHYHHLNFLLASEISTTECPSTITILYYHLLLHSLYYHLNRFFSLEMSTTHYFHQKFLLPSEISTTIRMLLYHQSSHHSSRPLFLPSRLSLTGSKVGETGVNSESHISPRQRPSRRLWLANEAVCYFESP